MSFWATDFWKSTFWANDFWVGLNASGSAGPGLFGLGGRVTVADGPMYATTLMVDTKGGYVFLKNEPIYAHQNMIANKYEKVGMKDSHFFSVGISQNKGAWVSMPNNLYARVRIPNV